MSAERPRVLPANTVCACLHRKVTRWERCERCGAFMEADPVASDARGHVASVALYFALRDDILAIEAAARADPVASELDANDWRELFAQIGQKWAALLEHYDLAEDATPEDIIRVAESRGAWDALARQGLRPPRPPKPSANREWDGS